MNIISSNGTTLAIIVRAEFRSEAIDFVTPDNNDLQVGYMSRPEGYVIRAHRHLPVERALHTTQEVLFIRDGIVRVDFYSPEEVYIQSEILNPGDLIVLISGGHGFKIIKPADIIEVKQGPYVPAKDKIFFHSVHDADVRIEGKA